MDPRHASHRRRALIAGTLLLVPAMLLGLRYPTGRAAAGWSVAWMAVLTSAALLSGRERFATVAFHLAAIMSGVAATALVLAAGGTTGPRFGFLLALAPLVLVVVPDLPWASALAGAVAVGGGLVIIAAEARGTRFTVEWLVLALSVIVISGIGAIGFRNLWYRELHAQTEYSSALLRLAESEQRRERAERFALVAKLAARLAHELSNPLAAVKANISWLAEDAAGGSLETQARDVLAETRASIERIGVIAADLRDLAKVIPGEAVSRDISSVLEEAVRGLDHPVRDELRIRIEPRLHAVVDGVLLAQCVRHLVLGGVPLVMVARDWPAVCLDAAHDGAGVVIELSAQENGSTIRHAERPVDGTLAVATGTHAGLHLALADELARTIGGTFETLRAANGALRFRVRLLGGSGSAGEP